MIPWRLSCEISDDLSKDKLPAILIGNIATSIVSKKPCDNKDIAIPDTVIHPYTGPKKPKMHPEEVKPGVFLTEMIKEQVSMKKIRQELD